MSDRSRRRARRAWSAARLLAAGLTALPLLFARHLPFSDVPEHLAAITTLSTYFDPRFRSAEYFEVQGALRTTYLLYHLTAALLAHVVGGAANANTLLLVLAALAMIPSLTALLRAVRGDTRLALVAGPLFWNRALAEGLVNYVASIPLTLGMLALAVRHTRAPRRGRAALLFAGSVLLFYLHTSSFVLFIVGATVALVLSRRPYRARPAGPLARLAALARRAPWLAAATALAPVLALSNLTSAQAGGEHAGVVRFLPTRVLAHVLFGWMHDVWIARWDDRAARGMWAAVALLALARGARRTQGQARVAWALAGLGALFYFALPNQVSYAFILELRMAPYVGLLGVLALAARRGRVATLAGVLLLGTNVVFGVLGARAMATFERDEARHFELVLQNLPRGKRLLTLVFHTASEQVIVTPFVHFGSYYRAQKGGVAGFSFSELPHWPVRYRKALAPPQKAVTFWDWNPCLYRNDKDGAYYDFVLVRGDVDPFAAGTPGPRFRVIGMAKDWVLYEKTAAPWLPGEDTRGPCQIDRGSAR